MAISDILTDYRPCNSQLLPYGLLRPARPMCKSAKSAIPFSFQCSPKMVSIFPKWEFPTSSLITDLATPNFFPMASCVQPGQCANRQNQPGQIVPLRHLCITPGVNHEYLDKPVQIGMDSTRQTCTTQRAKTVQMVDNAARTDPKLTYPQQKQAKNVNFTLGACFYSV